MIASRGRAENGLPGGRGRIGDFAGVRGIRKQWPRNKPSKHRLPASARLLEYPLQVRTDGRVAGAQFARNPLHTAAPRDRDSNGGFGGRQSITLLKQLAAELCPAVGV